jgi:hypothetical protein
LGCQPFSVDAFCPKSELGIVRVQTVVGQHVAEADHVSGNDQFGADFRFAARVSHSAKNFIVTMSFFCCCRSFFTRKPASAKKDDGDEEVENKKQKLEATKSLKT